MSDETDKTGDYIIKNLDSYQIKCIENLFREKKWIFESEKYDENADKEVYECANTHFKIEPIDGETKCIYCFCQPCVTNEQNRQQWWGTDPTAPGIENSGKRKKCYQRFWAMMAHRHVWNIPEYLEKRAQSLSENRHKCVIIHREIMPDCVLSVVRNWYPNPPKVQYMGHKWN